VGDAGWWSTTAAWGRRHSSGGPQLDAFILETSFKPAQPWTVFGRFEMTGTDELTPGLANGPAETVGKISFGVIHDWQVADHVKLGAGGLYAFNYVPGALARFYGSDDPQGDMIFLRLKID
jgi:hypothetical protein